LEFYKKGVLLEDVNSIYHLANMYLKGLGTVKDKQKAIELLKLGVEKRSVVCLSLLGETYYQDGEYAEAVKLLSPAAEAGEPRALYLMGVAHGTEIPDQTTFTYDLNKANEYYQKAALAGSHEAMVFFFFFFFFPSILIFFFFFFFFPSIIIYSLFFFFSSVFHNSIKVESQEPMMMKMLTLGILPFLFFFKKFFFPSRKKNILINFKKKVNESCQSRKW